MINLEAVTNIARDILDEVKKVKPELPVTIERLSQITYLASRDYCAVFDEDIDTISENSTQKIVENLMFYYTIETGDSFSLDDNPDHIEWLEDKRNQFLELDPVKRWPFFTKYLKFLKEEGGFTEKQWKALNRDTDRILSKIESPDREGTWNTKGMVVGQVQSGKTANYVGLINKAADCGYKLIIVLGGHTNALRAQTQSRLDDGFLGYDTYTRRLIQNPGLDNYIGVGKYSPKGKPLAECFTDSSDGGDMTLGNLNQASSVLNLQSTTLLVIKKNQSVLNAVSGWVDSVVKEDIPFLLIDDECDYASIDTSPDDAEDPSTINKYIRKLLTKFARSAFIGYTATPFANVFINPETDDDKLGPDLFPRHFIVDLPVPENYFGPEKLFGTTGFEDSSEHPGMPELIVKTSDTDSWLPDGHKKDTLPGPLPGSLKRAIKSFILSLCVKNSRGIYGHNTMLIHVTRFIDVQNLITEQICEYVEDLNFTFRYGNPVDIDPLTEEFHSLWMNDFEPTAQKIRSYKADKALKDKVETWDEIRPLIPKMINSVADNIIAFNGSSKESLDYNTRQEKHRNLIAIGGDKLSRGLTLNGLNTCYFRRHSKMYDTLMQMARWFGYRDGYTDVLRLYSDPQLINHFQHITNATRELMNDFQIMDRQKRTPLEFLLKVRAHPTAQLMVSSPSKTRNSRNISYTFNGDDPSSLSFKKDSQAQARDQKTLKTLIETLKGAGHRPELNSVASTNNLYFKNVEPQHVKWFFQSLSAINPASNPLLIDNYIDSRIRKGQLTDWSILLVSNSRTDCIETIAGHKIGLSQRTQHKKKSNPELYEIRALLDPQHQSADLSLEEKAKALEKTCARYLTEKQEAENVGKTFTKKPPQRPAGPEIREVRPPSRGLLIIYLNTENLNSNKEYFVSYTVSFPYVSNAEPVKYLFPKQHANTQGAFNLECY